MCFECGMSQRCEPQGHVRISSLKENIKVSHNWVCELALLANATKYMLL